jgi:hypothetical protein
MRRSAKLNAVVCVMVFAAAACAAAKQGETLNQQGLMESTERRATGAERNNLRGQIDGAARHGNDGLGRKLAQLNPPFRNRPLKDLLPKLQKNLVPKLQEDFKWLKGLPPFGGQEAWGAHPEQSLQKSPAERAAAQKAAEKAAARKAAAEHASTADRSPLLLGFGAVAAFGLVLFGVGLWLFKRGRAVQQTSATTPTVVAAATTGGKAGPTVSDIVNCSLFAPPRVAPGAKFTVQAYLHVCKDFVKVTRAAAQIDARANRLGYKQLPLPVPRGADVQLFLEFDQDLIIGQPFRQLQWQGAPAKEVFEVEVPANLASEPVKGILTFGVNNVPVGDIEFKLHVSTTADVSTEEPVETHVLKYANVFISYSRKDFSDASLVAQTLATVQVKLLVDVTELEPGDDWAKELPTFIGCADIFYLIWSENASKSEWVDKEARLARSLYDTSDPSRPRIVPITLKRPAPKPPDYLRRFHFDSPWLAQRTAHEVPLFVESS